MSTNLFPTRPVKILACSTISSNPTRPEILDKKIPSSSPSTWWGPVFGWSTDPDYIESSDRKVSLKAMKATARAAPGAFTEEKARTLRKMMSETMAFHDAMYHSSIAAKLASDFSDR
ncbi:hypothetical protein LIER_02299 [Lithospermum erythrorhizon]|uniref:Uncharacterized protein n=1 Tax=Lithospermum erythrorhizon TaxID=34254 RepID=A0AAV3NP04_LITER